VFIVSVII